MLPAVRLAYADPPYPGKAHLYPENTEVDHVELLGRLASYDGWALSTDETNLRYVLGLCPPKTRVLAWCRNNAPPFVPYPYSAWEPVLCKPARTNVTVVRSYFEGHAGIGSKRRQQLTGQKTPGFCEWLLRCLGALPDDTLDDLYPGTGSMGDTFERVRNQLQITPYRPPNDPGPKVKHNKLLRAAESLPGLEHAKTVSERAT